jgi:hypothetical protein
MNIALVLTLSLFASPSEAGAPVHSEVVPAPAAPSVGQTIGCPTREAVAAALSPALVHIRPNADPLPSDFRTVDLGDAFEVTASGQAQRYADAARDCAERARVAAVFVALAMNPPSLEAPRPPTPPPPVVQPPPPPPPPEGGWLFLGLAARLDGAVGGGGEATSGATAGGEIDVAFGRGSFGVEATAGAMTATENTVVSVQVK